MTIRDGNFVLVDWDAFTGRSVWSYFDGQQTHYRIDYPVTELIEQNKSEANAAPSGWAGDWHKIASVPLNVLHSSGLDEAMTARDNKFVSKFLNDSDNRAWRTKKGRV